MKEAVGQQIIRSEAIVSPVELEKKIENIYEEVVRFRRKMHEYPEIGMEERETTKAIVAVLERYGISHKKLNPTGVVAYVGKAPYKKALRGDIDGLKVEEQTNLSYCSKRPGYMHACGHDMHTTSLLYAAVLLKQMEHDLKEGIAFLFQPSEETATGSSFVLETGVLDDVEQMFGLHIFTDMEAGKVSLEAGERMAQTDKFKIEVKGIGGHAGKPHHCVDATVAAAAIVMNLQSIVSRELDPIESAVVTVGSLHSGTAYNIISGKAIIEGTFRSFSTKTAQTIEEAIERIAKQTASAYRATVTLEHKKAAHPPLINDKEMVDKVVATAKQYIDESEWIHVGKMMLGEDFANYQKTMRCCFAFVGAGQGEYYPNHHSKFNPKEDVLKQCIKLYISAALS